MGKKQKGMARVVSNLSDTPSVEIPVPVLPAVEAGRHPWFYFEDGTIVLKVGHMRVPSALSVTNSIILADQARPLQGSPTFSHRVLASVQGYVDHRVIEIQGWGRFQRRQPYFTQRR